MCFTWNTKTTDHFKCISSQVLGSNDSREEGFIASSTRLKIFFEIRKQTMHYGIIFIINNLYEYAINVFLTSVVIVRQYVTGQAHRPFRRSRSFPWFLIFNVMK